MQYSFLYCHSLLSLILYITPLSLSFILHCHSPPLHSHPLLSPTPSLTPATQTLYHSSYTVTPIPFTPIRPTLLLCHSLSPTLSLTISYTRYHSLLLHYHSSPSHSHTLLSPTLPPTCLSYTLYHCPTTLSLLSLTLPYTPLLHCHSLLSLTLYHSHLLHCHSSPP